MCCKWEHLIEKADKEEIRKKLDEEKLYDMNIIDTLYSKELITRDDYILYLKQIMNNHSDYARFLEIIVSCAERRDDYKPEWHKYFCGTKEE